MELTQTQPISFPLGIAEGQYFCNRETRLWPFFKNGQSPVLAKYQNTSIHSDSNALTNTA